MHYTTQGIVLHFMKYRDTSIIAKIITKALGNQTYIIPGVRTKRPKYTSAFFQPLTRLEMVVHHRKQRHMQRLSELQCSTPNTSIFTDRKKGALAIFLTELLARVIQEEEKNEHLFDFLWTSITELNTETTYSEFFYASFMLQLSRYLGFDISKPQYMSKLITHAKNDLSTQKEICKRVEFLYRGDQEKYLQTSHTIRRAISGMLIRFYQYHIETLRTMKSLEILRAISRT